MQRLREKIKIEPGDAAATGEDEEEGYGKRQRRQRRWNEEDRILGRTKHGMERLIPLRFVPSRVPNAPLAFLTQVLLSI
ncbi:hypothetical protein D8674_037537 [Pyrus ussuriensis x Pyrus communis]|uniref:Uncharacterized protein n=1 Tax=Pyrus ussuriensis x Pyrus communis TaxID=2448454 RepID=A0A5N5GHX8_9ROSA|nr:hypothetical protein D8674_037537 [Pyrus ussuriensis x Pyrus communis]